MVSRTSIGCGRRLLRRSESVMLARIILRSCRVPVWGIPTGNTRRSHLTQQFTCREIKKRGNPRCGIHIPSNRSTDQSSISIDPDGPEALVWQSDRHDPFSLAHKERIERQKKNPLIRMGTSGFGCSFHPLVDPTGADSRGAFLLRQAEEQKNSARVRRLGPLVSY